MYERVFLTTRNGLFFGFPMMCIGSLIWRRKKGSLFLVLLSGFALFTEITFVGLYADAQDDRSMYFLLPFFIYALVLLLRDWNPEIEGKHLAGISSAIYMMQFGIITIGTIVIGKINLLGTDAMWLLYLAVLIIPTIFYIVLRNTRVIKVLF